MSTCQNTAGNPRPDWLAKIEAYATRVADAIIDAVGPLVKDLDELGKSVVQRIRRARD